MSSAPYRLIAIDIDGTLLNSQREITPRTLRAIEKAITAGKRVALCTGRSLQSARAIAEQTHPEAILIFHSGALILETLNGPLLKAVNLPRALAFEIILYFKEKGYDPLVYESVPEGLHFWYEPPRSDNEWQRRYIQGSGPRARQIGDLSGAPFVDPAQVAIAGSEEAIIRMRALLNDRWPGIGVILSRSTLGGVNWFMEVVPAQVSKAQGLAVIGTAYGIDPKEMIAVGDNFNDLDMIEYAGLGVAMGNAPEAVKESADFVAPSNDEEGVAYVIERFFL